MRIDVALSRLETEEPYRWSSMGSTSTLTQGERPDIKFPASWFDESFRSISPRFLATFPYGTDEGNFKNLWAPRADKYALLSSPIPSEKPYFVIQVSTGSWIRNDNIFASSVLSQVTNELVLENTLRSSAFDLGGTIHIVERYYQLENPADVRDFLRMNLPLVDVLVEALSPLNNIFGNIQKLLLEVVIDPEAPEYKELVCSVYTTLEPEEALSKLDAFDDSWFLSQIDKTKGALNFRLDFV